MGHLGLLSSLLIRQGRPQVTVKQLIICTLHHESDTVMLWQLPRWRPTRVRILSASIMNWTALKMREFLCCFLATLIEPYGTTNSNNNNNDESNAGADAGGHCRWKWREWERARARLRWGEWQLWRFPFTRSCEYRAGKACELELGSKLVLGSVRRHGNVAMWTFNHLQ